jgi:hypothetical protein
MYSSVVAHPRSSSLHRFGWLFFYIIILLIFFYFGFRAATTPPFAILSDEHSTPPNPNDLVITVHVLPWDRLFTISVSVSLCISIAVAIIIPILIARINEARYRQPVQQ